MKFAPAIFAALAALALPAASVRTATETFVTNKIEAAVQPLAASVSSVQQSVSEVRQSVAVAAQSATNYTNAALEPYCTIAAARAMTNDVMAATRRAFLPATYEAMLYSWVIDVPLYVPQSVMVADFFARDSLTVGSWEFFRSDFSQQTLPQYLDEREAALTNGFVNGETLTNVVRAVVHSTADYVWDARDHVCYRREFSGGYLAYIAVTNIDLTNPTNYVALVALEGGL